jgi:hypothetical protein
MNLPKKAPAPNLARRPQPALTINRYAHDHALHYLARASEYRISPAVRHLLTEVVEGHIRGHCNEARARAGLAFQELLAQQMKPALSSSTRGEVRRTHGRKKAPH